MGDAHAPVKRACTAFRPVSGPRPGRLAQTWAALCDRSSLPPDVIDDEVTEVICFKASLALNRLSGGAADMTFSARAHLAATDRRSLLRRCLWRPVRGFIDLACAILRGEAHHCETAWINHCRRPGNSPAPG